jgi:hypothetical protein
MKINYVLHPNLMTPDPDDCKASVVNRTVFYIDDIVKQMTGEGSILKPTECYAVIDSFLTRIGFNLAEGICFSSEYFSVGMEISGVFVNDKDRFDPNRHMVYPNLKPGKEWKSRLAEVQLEKVTADENKPKPENVIDMKSKTSDQQLSVGGMAEIQGDMLKIDENAVDEGIFIISENGGGEIKVSYLYQNYPKNLQFEIPDSLKAGSYRLEVRNRAHKGKGLRAGSLDFSLIVAWFGIEILHVY